MADNKQQQLTIWGRANSVNVQKVLWCLAELGLAYERIDAGMQFGKNNEPAYLAMNPNGRVPTLVDGDYVLWESNSVMRYLCMAYGVNSPIYPAQPQARAGVDALIGEVEFGEAPQYFLNVDRIGPAPDGELLFVVVGHARCSH